MAGKAVQSGRNLPIFNLGMRLEGFCARWKAEPLVDVIADDVFFKIAITKIEYFCNLET